MRISRTIFEVVLDSWFSHINQIAINELNESDEAPTPEAYNSIVLRQLNRQIRRFEKSKTLILPDSLENLKTQYSEIAAKVVETNFESSALREAAMSFVWPAIAGSVFSPISSGILVAGFGCGEVFPSLYHFETDGYIGSAIKLDTKRTAEISMKNRSAVAPFAQREMVSRFMDGIDPEYSRFLGTMSVKATIAACKIVLDKYAKEEYKNEETFSQIVSAAIEGGKQTLVEARKFQWKKFSRPIINMIAMLSKDELAHVAESLVALTSLKRHVSEDAETVGGPVDVALISKGDGFIWIKRKHYFKPELDVAFFENYFRLITRDGVSHGNATAAKRKV